MKQLKIFLFLVTVCIQLSAAENQPTVDQCLEDRFRNACKTSEVKTIINTLKKINSAEERSLLFSKTHINGIHPLKTLKYSDLSIVLESCNINILELFNTKIRVEKTISGSHSIPETHGSWVNSASSLARKIEYLPPKYEQDSLICIEIADEFPKID